MQILYIFLTLSLTTSSTIFARWLNIEEAETQNKFNVVIHVNDDSSFKEEIEETVIITRDEGKTKGVKTLYYNNFSQTINIIEAYTIFEGKKIHVAKSDIEDKMIASSSVLGFDSYNKVTLNYPNVAVGSQLYLKYTIENKKATINNLWTYFINHWIYSPLLKGSKISIHSSEKIQVILESFQTKLKEKIKISRSKPSKQKNTLVIELTDNIFYNVQEEMYPYLAETLPYIFLSNKESMKQLEKSYIDIANSFHKNSKDVLPDLFENMFVQAQRLKKEGLEKTTEFIIAKLIKNIRYFGDWRSIEGKIAPRSLKETSSSAYGDCKDFSLVLFTILKRLGYDASAALVHRGDIPPTQKNQALFNFFNHAIVHVKHNKKDYWFDATNNFAYTKNPLEDISGRYALILRENKDPLLSFIKEIEPHENTIVSQEEILFLNDQTSQNNLKVNYKGVAAFELANRLNSFSQQQVNYNLVKKYFGAKEILKQKKFYISQDFNDNKIIGDDVNFETIIHLVNPPTTTTAGQGFELYSWINFFKTINPREYECSGIHIGSIKDSTYSVLLKDKKLLLDNKKVKLFNHIKSPWVEYLREIKQTTKGIEAISKVKILKKNISHNDLRGSEFAHFQKTLREEFNNLTLIFKS